MGKSESVHQVTEWQKKRVGELIDEGLSQKVISKRVGLTYGTVNRLVALHRKEKQDGDKDQSGE